jgi:co-chaperonin GroES (HSP10)
LSTPTLNIAALEPGAEDIRGVVEPTGYKLLIYIPHLESQMRNGLFRPDQNRDAYEVASLVGQVIAIGPLAYKDGTKFPGGAWCEVGDYIMMHAYAGTRFQRAGSKHQYRLINDDTVEAVLRGAPPDEIERP